MLQVHSVDFEGGMRAVIFLVSIVTASLASGVAFAEVEHVSPHGFVSTHELALDATPAESYRAFVQDVAQWWDATHSYSGEASAFSIDDQAGGCFCETTGDIRVQHMRVVNVHKGRSITMLGGLGPLQSMAVHGSMSFVFLPGDTGTTLQYQYSVGGYLPGGLESLAGPVDQVQLSQLKRLQAYLAKE